MFILFVVVECDDIMLIEVECMFVMLFLDVFLVEIVYVGYLIYYEILVEVVGVIWCFFRIFVV